jgi:serine/threonine protein kinase
VLELGKQRHILREKEILKALKHPTIIRLLKTFKDEENLYFIFEHAENGTLDDFIKFCHNKVGEDLVKILFAQMINFMEYIQINGILHRDLKPGNIMMDENYNIKIIDFGDAK